MISILSTSPWSGKSDGVELMKATGDDNDSENYVSKQFDASAYIGVECYVRPLWIILRWMGTHQLG